MPCLLSLLALFFPRVIIILLALFSSYLSNAYQTMLWPILGFFFFPFTTLAYAVAMNENGGSVNGLYLVLVVIGVLLDLGSFGGGGASYRKRKR